MARKKQPVEIAADKNIFHKLSPFTALVLGIVMLLTGIILSSVSLRDRIIEISALEKYNNNVVIRKNGEFHSDYNGYPIITYGELSYEDGSAKDTLFGVSADTAILYRISEMYQWTAEDGKIVAVWSEELIPSPDSEHENPTAFPSNTKSNYYTARTVTLGGYSISADVLLMLNDKAKLEKLPSVDTRGFSTDGEYITNAEDLSAPKVGDVRIRYEYATADVITIAGKQRSETIVGYGNYGDTNFFLAKDGEHSQAKMISALRDIAVDAVWWMLILGCVLTALSGFLIFDGFVRLTKYSPKFPSFAKGKSEICAPASVYIYSAALGAISLMATLSLLWAETYPIPAFVTAVAAVIYFYILGGDIIKNMPRPKKKEAEYVPILIKRDDDKKRK